MLTLQFGWLNQFLDFLKLKVNDPPENDEEFTVEHLYLFQTH